MTAIDWIIIAFVAMLAVIGYQQGLLVGALSLGGFSAGAVLGSRLGPELLSGGSESPYAPVTALLGGLLLGGIVAVSVEGLARAARTRWVRGGVSTSADRAGGAVLLAALACGLAWVFGAVALHTPGARELRPAIQRSVILRELNELLPPSGPILQVLNRIDPTPRVRGPQARVPPPESGIARDPDVRGAGRSVARVLGTACGLGVSGSGWVAEPGLVVTNAHVVAGQDDTTVTTRGGAELDATPVHFEPRNDLAVLRVDGLSGPPLPFASAARRGTAAAVLGFPENGPFTIAPARLGQTTTVLSEDAYARGPVSRRMTSFRGTVRSGNSGGPAVDADGRVLTTVFAAAVGGEPPSGLGVPNEVVDAALERTGGAVDTGACIT
ncbi:MAG TPA: MarP family serine protease [Solirubrobacterales bacterium]|nr:MarP family serine protease [Solirubrobacterales bacterium]